MRNRESIAQLRAELQQDWDFIQHNCRKNAEMKSRIDNNLEADEFAFAALGYTLHNLYNSFESYFARIAKFFENNLEQSAWHKSLLERMTLSIDGVRPSLFDQQFRVRLEELLRFRHVFRNLYRTPLVPEKVLFAQKQADRIGEDFQHYHQQFLDFLIKLEDNLNDQEF